MEIKDLANTINKIEMPKEMEVRIMNKCYAKMEESVMEKKNRRNIFRNPMVAAASLAVCLCLTGVTALAATGKLQGVFKDIVRWDKTVIGTSYENATDEIDISAFSNGSDQLTVVVELNDPAKVPYSEFDYMGMLNYEIIDENGNVIKTGNETELCDIVSGNVSINILLESIPEGTYKLKITAKDKKRITVFPHLQN